MLILTLLLLCHFWPIFGQSELCWESCFQVEDRDEERFREIYDDFYRMGMEARRLKNYYGVNGTAFLLDSTLSATNPNDPINPIYQSPREQGSTADQVWDFQKNLAAITMILMGTQEDHNPIYLVQFDQDNANTCEEFHCLQACEANYLLDSELNVPRQASYIDGNIEAACSMSKKLMQTTPCVASLKNEMAIAYLNSGIQFHRYHKHKHDSSEEDHEFGGLKPCLSHFDTRMAIGTHVARWENLDRWSTKAARPFYFHDNVFTMSAAQTLRACLSQNCCQTGQGNFIEDITGNQCKRTEGTEGEQVVDFPGHTSYGP